MTHFNEISYLGYGLTNAYLKIHKKMILHLNCNMYAKQST